VVYSLKSENLPKMSDLCGKKVCLNIKSTTASALRAPWSGMANLKVASHGGAYLGEEARKSVGCGRCAVIFSYSERAQLQAKD